MQWSPDLPANADATPPWVALTHGAKQALTDAQASLGIVAAPDARWMYLREWTPDPTTGAWMVRQDSGWIDYRRAFTWTVSAGQGVKYLGLWVADGSGNVSTLDEQSLVFVNRLDGPQSLSDGQRVQYRGYLGLGTWILGVLKTISGDPDMYIWRPQNGYRPDGYSNDTVAPGQTEDMGSNFVRQTGRYLVDVQAAGDSEYELTVSGGVHIADAAVVAQAEKELPSHPLVISDPLSAGQSGSLPGLRPTIYLPAMYRQ